MGTPVCSQGQHPRTDHRQHDRRSRRPSRRGVRVDSKRKVGSIGSSEGTRVGANSRFQPGLFVAAPRGPLFRDDAARALDLQLEFALQFVGVRQLKPPDILRILLQMAPSMRTASLVLMLLLQLAAQCQAAVFDVTKFGAKGDGNTDDYYAVLKAAAACAAAGGGTLLFPAIPKQAALLADHANSPDSPPCAPTPCPGKPAVTFCSSNSSSGQCSDPMPHAPCPPCFNPSAGMLTGYVTGAFNISSHMHVEIEKGVHLLGAQNSSQWPLLTVADVWPGFGYARDGDFGGESGRLMHQSLLFTFSTTNVSVGGGGTIDCRGGYFQACGNNLTKAPCSGHARPECVFFSNSSDVVFEDVTVLNSPDWTLHFSSVDRLRVRRVNVTQPGPCAGLASRLPSVSDCSVELQSIQEFRLKADGLVACSLIRTQVEAIGTASTLIAARMWSSKIATLHQGTTLFASSQDSTGSAVGACVVPRSQFPSRSQLLRSAWQT